MELQLNNQKFGFWEVIEKDIEKSKEKHQSYWKCKCTLCGEIYSVRGSALKAGKTTKCVHCSTRIINEIGNIYNNLKVISYAKKKNNRAMWLCKCQCGNLIEVSGTDLRMGKIKSCGRCPTKESNGEKMIRKMLNNSGIIFISEYSFKDFKYENGYTPRFDFYIPQRNYIIEYDGVQHFKSTSGWNTQKVHQKTIEKDKIKNKYCFDHNIPIIRIPYNENDITIFDLIPETSRFLLERSN